MHIEVGDLVRCRSRGQKVGLVVDRKISNDGLSKSMHVRHLLSSYPLLYYVFFSDEGKAGPFYATDLTLQRSASDDDVKHV